MSCIFNVLIDKACIRRGFGEIVTLFVSLQWTHPHSPLREITNSYRIVNAENTSTFRATQTRTQSTKGRHIRKIGNKNVPTDNRIGKEAGFCQLY